MTLSKYFDNTSTDACASGPGPGLIETIKFADDPSVDFAKVKRLLGCAPKVIRTNPANNTTGIATDNVYAIFSKDMNPNTLTTSTFTLTKQGSSTPVDARVSYDRVSKMAILDPTSDLEATTTYKATIKGGSTGAKDLGGNALEQYYTWTFTTAATPLETSITSGPAEGSSTTSNSATFGFSSTEQDSTFQCQLSKGGTVAQAFAACTSPKAYSNLTPGNYKFEVKAQDSAGNVDPTPASRSWTITGTTPPETAPTVTGTVPGAVQNVDRTTNVTATFSEGMLASSINTNTFKLYKKGSTTKISATVSYDPNTLTATLNPFGSSTTRLARGTTYKAVVTTGAKDLAGTSLDQNPSLAGNQQKAWLFTTTP